MDMGSTRGCGCRGERALSGERAFSDHQRRPDHELNAADLAQRQLARQLRHDVRRVLREAEAAGLSPERAARVARRVTRRDDYL
jgi:alpha-D-ribose 1-methylphosphonate 5-triphosphate synthase subunit PhnI